MLFLTMFFVIAIGCNNPTSTPIPTPIPKVATVYSVNVLAANDTLSLTPVTVFSAVSSDVQTAGILFSDNQLLNKLAFTYVKSANTLFYSPRLDGMYVPYISGSSPPPIKK